MRQAVKKKYFFDLFCLEELSYPVKCYIYSNIEKKSNNKKDENDCKQIRKITELTEKLLLLYFPHQHEDER